MPKINLLPWREEQRQDLRKEFFTLMGASVAFGVLTLFCVHLLYQGWIDYQERKNHYLEEELAKLDERIKDIKNLQKERQQLLARVDVIEHLQKNRPGIVKMFDDLWRNCARRSLLYGLSRKDNIVTIEGRAESNTRVSKLMRNIELTSTLTDPRLDVIKKPKNQMLKRNLFQIWIIILIYNKIVSDLASESADKKINVKHN